MSASTDCQSNDSICNFLLKDGRVRDIGLYQYLYQEKIYEETSIKTKHVKSYRLFHRGSSVAEHPIQINNQIVLAQNRQPLTTQSYGVHKFYAG